MQEWMRESFFAIKDMDQKNINFDCVLVVDTLEFFKLPKYLGWQ